MRMFCLSFSFTFSISLFIALYYISFYSGSLKDTLSLLIELHALSELVFIDATVDYRDCE